MGKYRAFRLNPIFSNNVNCMYSYLSWSAPIMEDCARVRTRYISLNINSLETTYNQKLHRMYNVHLCKIWSSRCRLKKSMTPQPCLQVEIPRYQHTSVFRRCTRNHHLNSSWLITCIQGQEAIEIYCPQLADRLTNPSIVYLPLIIISHSKFGVVSLHVMLVFVTQICTSMLVFVQTS